MRGWAGDKFGIITAPEGLEGGAWMDPDHPFPLPRPAAADGAECVRQQCDHQRAEPHPDPAADGAGAVRGHPARGEEEEDGLHLPQLQGR